MVNIMENSKYSSKSREKIWIPLIAIAVISLLVLFAGCLDNEIDDIIPDEELSPEAVINLPKKSFDQYENIEFEIQNTGDTQLTFSRVFDVDYYNEDAEEWESVELDLVWPMDMIFLNPGESFTQSFNPADNFVDEVKGGEYRINKQITCVETDEVLELEKNFWIEISDESE